MAKEEGERDWMFRLTPGRCYLFEAQNSKYYVGRLVSAQGLCTAVLEDAAWVADTGRLHLFLRDGKAENMEVEPVGVVALNWVSWAPWLHKLFKEAV